MKKLVAIFLGLMVITCSAYTQPKPLPSQTLNGFKVLLANINGTFNIPENFSETKTPNSDKLPFQYGLKFPDADCEIWFQVNSIKTEWLKFERSGKQGINPDSSYLKIATDEAKMMCGADQLLSRPMPPRILEAYNADEGRSYFVSLADIPETKHYQYALLIVLHKNHYGNIVVACLTNDKGPEFFKSINKLRYCFRFNG